MDTERIRTEWEPASGSRLDQLLTKYDQAAEQAKRQVQTRRDNAEKELERRRAFWCKLEEPDSKKIRGADRGHGRKWPEVAGD